LFEITQHTARKLRDKIKENDDKFSGKTSPKNLKSKDNKKTASRHKLN